MAKKKKQADTSEILVSDNKRFKFFIRYTDPDGQKREGEFTSKIPSVMDLMKIGGISADNFRDVKNMDAVPVIAQNYSFMLATIKVCLVNWPDWFVVDKLEDEKLLEEVYHTHSAVVDQFRSKTRIKITGLGSE